MDNFEQFRAIPRPEGRGALPSLLVYFANQQESVNLAQVKESRFSLRIQELIQDFGLDRFVILDQVHGTSGLLVNEHTLGTPVSWFAHHGDFLVTNQKNIGLLVLTADCIPLVLYDAAHGAVALVHAGWRGSLHGVLQETLQTMQDHFATELTDLVSFFGPSARSCCYQVSELFVQDFIKKYPGSVSQFVKRGMTCYFDNSLFLQDLLKKFGIKEQNIYNNKALCTICNPEFCSYRRQQEHAERQMTLVALR
jgi:YfiH family protein